MIDGTAVKFLHKLLTNFTKFSQVYHLYLSMVDLLASNEIGKFLTHWQSWKNIILWLVGTDFLYPFVTPISNSIIVYSSYVFQISILFILFLDMNNDNDSSSEFSDLSNLYSPDSFVSIVFYKTSPIYFNLFLFLSYNPLLS